MADQQPEGPPEGVSPDEWTAYQAAGEHWGVDPYLLPAIREGEGTVGKLDTVTDAGKAGKARGPFQFLDSTAKEYGLKNPHDLGESADAAAHKLRDGLESHGNDPDAAVLTYTGGNVANWGPNTTGYRDRVAGAYARMSGRNLSNAGFVGVGDYTGLAQPKQAEAAPEEKTEAPQLPNDAQLDAMIEKAHTANYSDNAIADYMRTNAPYKDYIAEATKNGWKDQQIFGHLGLSDWQPQGTAAAMGHAAVQGAAELPEEMLVKPAAAVIAGTGAALQSAERNAQNFARQQIGVMDRIDSGEAVPDQDDPTGYQSASPAQRADMRKQYEAQIAAMPKPDDTVLSRTGKAVQQYGEGLAKDNWAHDLASSAVENFPISGENKDRFAVKLAGAMPGFAAYVGAGAVGGIPLVMGMAGTQAYGDKVAEAREKGLSEGDAQEAGLVSGLSQGALMGVPIAHMLETVPVAFRQKVLQGLWGAFKNGASMLTVTEAARVAQNVIDKQTGIDPERQATDGLGADAAQNFVLGVIPGAAAAGAGRIKRALTPRPAAAPVTEPAPQPEPPGAGSGEPPGAPAASPEPPAAPPRGGAPVEEMPDQPVVPDRLHRIEPDPAEPESWNVLDDTDRVVSANHATPAEAQAEADKRDAKPKGEAPPAEPPAEPKPRASVAGEEHGPPAAPDKPQYIGTKPADLLQFIAGEGGIKDTGGDLKAMGAPWWIRRGTGIPLDEMRARAQQEGYVPPDDPDRPAENGTSEFLDAIQKNLDAVARKDPNGRIYRETDRQEVMDRQEQADLVAGSRQRLDELGIPNRKYLDDDGTEHPAIPDHQVNTALQIAEATRDWQLDHEEVMHEAAMAAERAGNPDLAGILLAHHDQAADLPLDHLGQAPADVADAGAGRTPAAEGPRLSGEGDQADRGGAGFHEEVPAQLGLLQSEKTAQGEQTLIPGVTPIADRDRAQAAVNKPLAGKKAQKPADAGLFDTGARKQGDMFGEGERAAPPFYSALTRAVDDLKLTKAPASQWRGIIDNLPMRGVKQAEIDWSGVKDFLKGDGSRVITKGELMQHLHDNEVQVHEVVKGDEPGIEIPDNGAPQGWRGIERTTTKYHDYQMNGGTNYREMLLTLPQENVGKWEVFDPTDGKTMRIFDTEAEAQKDAVANRLDYGQVGDKSDTNTYRGRHWDEPNVLAHVRMNDRTDAQGRKLLHVEELQSDWHQTGRKYGYGKEPEPEPAKTYAADEMSVRPIADQYIVTAPDGKTVAVGRGTVGNEHYAKQYGANYFTNREADRFRDDALRASAHHAVPDAPFKKTWPELALKRVLRYAAENGYDGVSWTPGAEQAKRYDLSKHIDKITYVKEDGKWWVGATDKNGKDIESLEHAMDERQLENTLGKDLADKIMGGDGKPIPGGPEKELSGLDLKVGGEGMKGFYDKIVPDFLNKYGKKWGAKVGTSEIGAGNSPMRYDGPEPSREKIFEVSKRLDRGPESSVTVARQLTNVLRLRDTAGMSFHDAMDAEGSHALAEMLGGKMIEEVARKTVPSIDITPAMRKSVMEEGQALHEGEQYFSTEPTSLGPTVQGMPDLVKTIGGQLYAHKAAADWVIEKGHDGNEWLATIDQRTGLPTHGYSFSSPTDVGISPTLAKQLADPAARIVAHHNHPTGTALSGLDIQMLAVPGMDWVVAHAPDGAVSAAQLRPEMAKYLRGLAPGAQPKFLGDMHAKGYQAARREFDKAAMRGEIDPKDEDDALLVQLTHAAAVNHALDALGVTTYMGDRDIQTLLPGIADRAFQAAYRAMRPDATKAGLAPQEATDVRIHRPAGDLRSESGLAGVFGPAAETAAGRRADTERGAPGAGGAASEAAGFAEGKEEEPLDTTKFMPPDAGTEAGMPAVGRRPPEAAAAPTEPSARQDQVSNLIAAAGGGGKGPSPEARALDNILAKSNPRLKNLNPVEKATITPGAIARLDTHFARLWNAVKGKDLATNVTLGKLRGTIDKSLVKLDPASRDNVYAALELARIYNWRPKDNGALVKVKNTSAWYARKSQPGYVNTLNAAETRALHDAIKLGDQGRQTYIEALARRQGWTGPVDPAAIAKGAKAVGVETPQGRNLVRLASTVAMANTDMARPYFPAMRFGDHYIAVKPKAGADTESLGGYPEVKWFETVERSPLEQLADTWKRKGNTDAPATVAGRIAEIRSMRDNAGNLRFPADQYDIETGNLSRKQEILREINMPALEKLMMLTERNVKASAMEKLLRSSDYDKYRPVLERLGQTDAWQKAKTDTKRQALLEANYAGSADPAAEAKAFLDWYRSRRSATAERAEAKGAVQDQWKTLYDNLSNTLMEETYRELLAGYKRQAKMTPGYSGDFDRALGAHSYQLARSTADMVHRPTIDSAYESLQQFHPNERVRTYAKNWRNFIETPESPESRIANTVAGAGFAYALAMNPASTLVFAAHTPMAAAPIMSTGVGMGRASTALAAGLRRAYARTGFDLKQGAHIDLDKLLAQTADPQKRAYLKMLNDEGLLHAMGADDIGAMNDRAAAPWGELRPTMKKAMDVATSNIRIVDQANRIGIADAAYELARNPADLRKMAEPLMKNDAVFQDMVRTQGLSPETFGRFMLQKAGFGWGKMERSPIQRGPLGTMLFSLHGFQSRFLSSAWHLMRNMGPEGRIAGAWMLGGLAFGAGAYALPFTQDLENLGDLLWKRITGHDPMIAAHVQGFLSSAFGKVGAEMMLHGALSELLGTDMTARVGFGDVISREFSDPNNAIGTIPAMLWARITAAARRAASGQGALAAIAEVLPSGLRNPAMAAVQARQGVLSQAGNRERLPEEMTPSDIAHRAVGLQPLSQTRSFEKGDYAYRVEHQYDNEHRDVLHEAALYALQANESDKQGDQHGAAELRQRIQALVAQNPNAHITPQALANTIRAMSAPDIARLRRMQPALRQQALENPYPEP